MKKLLTIVVTLFFAATLYAGEVENTDRSTTLNHLKQQTELDAKSGKVRTSNQLLYNKKKELGKLNYDGTQVPHGPSNNDATIYNENFEGAAGIWTYNLAAASSAANGDTTTFNAYQGEGGEYSWWLGSNDPSYDQPGYGHNWRRYLRHNTVSYQLQPGLTSASIQFDAFYNLEEGWDGVHLQVSSDSGATWTNVACWSGTSGGWAANVDVDVSSFIGKWITFRFLLVSDGSFDSQDGEIGGFDNPGGFFFDNLEVRRNGVPELVSDGGDTKYNMYDGFAGTVNDWFLTTDESASGDTSVGHLNYQMGEFRAFTTFSFADLDVANTVAPLWLDFNVYSTIPYDANAAGGVYTYWRPVAYFYGNGTLAPGFYTLSASVYVGEFGDAGNFVSYSDNFGYIDLEAFRGGDIEFGILYASFGGCSIDEGELYVDDFKVIQKNDPYEYNDDCDTASLIDYGFVSEFANIWDATDVDWFYFEGTEGDWVDVYVDNSDIDLELSLWSASDNETCVDWLMAGRPCCPVYSYDDGDLYDRIIWRLPYTGGYFAQVDGFGDVGGYVMYLDQLDANASIASISDRAGDQGGVVTLQFTAPELDNLEDVDFTRWGATSQAFQIERKKNIISSDYDIVAQLEAFGLAADGQAYRIDVPTVGDSMNSTYRVRTKTGVVDYQGVFTTVSAEATGQSYDNIAPVFELVYTAAPQAGTGVDVGAEVDYGGGNDGISDLSFYNIYRSTDAGFTASAANLIATVETHETSIRYNDAEYDGNTEYYYIIEVVDDGGNMVFSSEVNTTTGVEDEAVPTVYSLSQNYPNPFNPATTIKFGIPQAADVTVKIYDILGQEVKTLMNRNLAAGFHTVNFDASNLISGMYIYRIQANGVDGSNFTDVKKMLLVK